MSSAVKLKNSLSFGFMSPEKHLASILPPGAISSMLANGAYTWQCPKLNPVIAKPAGPEAAARASPRARQTVLWTWPTSVLCSSTKGRKLPCCFPGLGPQRHNQILLRRKDPPIHSTASFPAEGALFGFPALPCPPGTMTTGGNIRTTEQSGLTQTSPTSSPGRWQDEFPPPRFWILPRLAFN